MQVLIDESNFAQRWKKWEQSVEFYLTASGTDNDSQMQALLLHCAGPDVQDIFMHLQDVGTTYKAAMDALNNHFESKKNVVFERHVFRQAMQGTNESSLTFVTRLRKLASTCEFENEIRDQFIDKCSSNRLRRRLLQEPNVTLENIVEKTQAMELAEMELFAMHPDEMQAGMARLKVTQDKYDFPSNKCCFRCRSSTHLANKCNIAKGKTCRKCGKVGHFTAVCKSKPQNLPVNLLRNENPSDDEYCFTINSPLAKTTFTLNNALPVEFLIDSGSSVNIINRDTFEKLESLMSLTRERSCVKLYPYGCKTTLPILRKCVVDIGSNCTDKRTFATFHVTDAATSCILGKSTSELLCVLTVLQPTRSERISAFAN